jgi:hypothetical protein
MVAPDSGSLPPPHEDMSDAVKAVYREAAAVSGKSPRAAAALLRLALESLLKLDLNRPEKDLNAMIGGLARDLPEQVIQAMDVVRVHGNGSVHAGQIDVDDDDPETVGEIATIINFVIDRLIAQPLKVENMYNAIPEAKRQAADDRNDRNRLAP